ncbi:thyroid adenoma-associated-like protein [Perilla frutescens var. frutescens]|nr:thyroid adenoma-associated-like protein [Perilla frutescens var. frutescens]
MSAKWRAIQHRHRYTYSAVLFPPHFTEALNQTPCESAFFAELMQLISLNSTYAQLEHVKKLAAAFSNLLSDRNTEENAVSCAVKLYMEILFLENSLPLHRTLASALAKCKSYRSLIEDCFRQLCEEYGGGNNASNGKRFCVSRAALSMMSTPKLGYLVQVVEQCAILVGLDVILGLQSVVKETDELSRPSPIVMEQCQEALSCMYYLFQRFPDKFYSETCGHQGLSLNKQSVIEMAFTSVLSILKSSAFSRDCFVAAGVSFCAALQVCLSPDELGLFIMLGIFYHCGIQDCDISLDVVVRKISYKGDLIDEIHKFSALSRLCLIRGILTAVSRTVLDKHYVVANEGCIESGDGGCTVKTILYDAILPELCIYAENPRDSHSNFHALTVMQICLQQIKTLLLGDTAVNADTYDPIPEQMGARILKTVWNNLEDPLSQTVRQVHLIFDLYLDMQSSLHWAEGSENIKMFLRKIAYDLLCLGPRCKGRYIPLASLTRRLGAKTILEMNPDMLCETTKAYLDDDVCCAATTFFKCFLECLRDEYWSSDGVESGYTKYRGHCLLPFLQGLAFGVTKLRSNLNTYALPILLELDVDSIFSMLALIGIGGDDGPLSASTEITSTDMTLGLEQRIAVLVSLLKVSRGLALMEGDVEWYEGSTLSPEGALLDMENNNLHCVVLVKGVEVKIPVKWLILALTHIDESLRMDAAETLFLNPKKASLPSPLELSLMRRAIPLNMRCCSTAFQMKWNSLFRKFFSRVRTALERQLKLGTWKPLVSGNSNGEDLFTGAEKTEKHRAEYLYDFTTWFSRFLFFSCYPSAPYERKTMAMELILILLNVWPVAPTLHGNQDGFCFENNLSPYSKGYTSPDSTLLLVGSIVDSWDRLRECSLLILLYFPTPLPGICSPESVSEAIRWAKKLICSPRVRESDAGALTLRLIFRKYVLDLSWIVQPSCNGVSFCLEGEQSNGPYQICTSSSPVISYMASLIDWLLAAVEDAEKNLSEACKNSFVHGILLALRYTFEELDWNSNVFHNSIGEMKHLLERFLELVTRITALALWVVSADAWYLPDDMEEMMDDEAFSLEIPDEIDSPGSESQVEVKVAKSEEEIKPSEQIVMVGCWLAMKEVSLLLGTVIRKVPLPTSDEMRKAISDASDKSIQPSDALLDLRQLETIGNHFLEVLLKMKHNGAIDKTRAGFTALCNRLLCSNDPRLCQLTESWMDRLMERTVAKGQTVDDLLRRSAGIPAAFIAFFLSEPEGAPKRLLPRALRWLIGVVRNSLADQLKASGPPASGVNGNIEMSKFRDEGVVPTVHAFNVLKAAFNDTNLATDTSGFCAEALIISICSFSSPYWEVRNSACLAYTALVRRMIGFLNVQKRQSARRAVTGLEFFHRYPTLHSFLLTELKVATESLLEGSSDDLGSNLKNVVHPSLCPMLILLSRLKPSLISSETGDTLEPFLFMPFIRRCSFQNNLRIRVLAARASTGLVANEKLQVVMLNIASELPCERSHIMAQDSFSSGAYCSFNTIHGMLLQLISLLDTNCRNLSDSSKKDTILLELIQILATRSWIGRPRQCPCPILNCCMVKVLDNMLSIVGTCEASRSADIIWNLLWELSSECLDLEPADSPLYFDPTIQELRKQAATSYFNCIFATSKDIAEDEVVVRRTISSPATILSRAVGNEGAFTRFQERLIRSMSDASYEVRIASLKWLFLFLKRGEYSGYTSGDQFYCEALKMCLTNINLQDTVVKLLVSERHHKCMHYLLKVLYIWNSLEFQDNQPSLEPRFICNMDRHAIFQLWNTLVSLFKITRHAKTRQTLICCLGMCVKKISSLCMSFISSEVEMTKTAEPIQTDRSKIFSDFYDALMYFVDLIEQNSDASQPVTMRKAAAESIVASGILTHAEPLGSLIYIYPISDGDASSHFKPEEAIRLYARKVLDLWLTCIKLLEDEDVNLRKRLALDVQKSLPSREPTKDSPAATGTSQVEKVIESCFEHLSTVFGHWIDYLDYLCCWVMNTANNTNYVASGGDLVRRVFDKEIDNHHEEKLLICQICCSHLETNLVSKPQAGESWIKSGARHLLHRWRTRFFKQLTAFIHDHIGNRGSDDWIGGVGNHKDAFLPLYANLAAFYALSNCILKQEPENSRGMLDDVSALGEAISPFLCNPLISNLYSVVVKSHEKYLGETAAENLSLSWRENESLWGEFNPYFLLG